MMTVTESIMAIVFMMFPMGFLTAAFLIGRSLTEALLAGTFIALIEITAFVGAMLARSFMRSSD